MHSSVEIETENPGQLRKVLEPSLPSEGDIHYSLETGKNLISIDVETEGLGQLRGCTDTVFRLTTLAKKIL